MRTIIIVFLAALLAPGAMAGTVKPVKIYIVAGQLNAESRQNVNFLKENFPEYAAIRDDLWLLTPGKSSPTPFMGPSYKTYGVEHAAGYVLAEAVENDVVFIRSAVGGTMLHTRWRSPSAVERLGGPVGDLYDTMIRRVHNQVANLEMFLPSYRGQGYELAGFIWFQGENDCCARTQGFYRDGLMDLIKDVRAELGVPNLPFGIAKINDGCWGPPAVDIWAANEFAAHADPNVVAINTRDLRGLCHYDPQSYVTIGQRLGKALLPFAKTPVHVGDGRIRAASRAYFARIAGPGGPQDMTSLKDGLVGYWKFDEEEGTTAKSAFPGGVNGRTFSRPDGSAGLLGEFPFSRPLAPGRVGAPVIWKHRVMDDPAPPSGWAEPGFDDASWPETTAPVKGPRKGGATAGEIWDKSHLLMRHTFKVDTTGLDALRISALTNDQVDIYLNGAHIARILPGKKTPKRPFDFDVTSAGLPALRRGTNVLAVKAVKGTQGNVEVRLLGVKR